MPDVEVRTYCTRWPVLVDDLDHLPKGMPALVVGYGFGANSTVFVTNRSVTSIPSSPSAIHAELESGPDRKDQKIVEMYDPRPEQTLGGIESKSLVRRYEYIANDNSHMGTQFGSDSAICRKRIARLSLKTAVAAQRKLHCRSSRPHRNQFQIRIRPGRR